MKFQSFIAVLTFGFLLLSVAAYAGVGFGTIQSKKSAIIKAGNAATFKLLFFNLGPDSQHINLKASAPEGWKISTTPEEFDLIPSAIEKVPTGHEEYIALPGIDGYVKATTVWADVKVPPSAQSGTYTVNVRATAAPSGTHPSNTSMAITQERDFAFVITVEAQEFSEQTRDGLQTTVGQTIQSLSDVIKSWFSIKGEKNETSPEQKAEPEPTPSAPQKSPEKLPTPEGQEKALEPEGSLGITGRLILRPSSLLLVGTSMALIAYVFFSKYEKRKHKR